MAKNFLKKIISDSNKFSSFIFLISGFVLAISIGAIRYLTGPELALSLFYLIPISLTTWKVGRGAGIFISFTSAVSWLLADLLMLHEFSNPILPFLNETFRLIVFLIITYTLFGLKTLLESQKALARTDSLTGIANRRAFFELAQIELQKARRFKHPISILYLDLDNFKNINDRFGHHTGDSLLCLVAENIKKGIRETDTIARFGGDEFVIMLSETKSSYSVAVKIQKKLLNIVKDKKWPVTFSIGAVTFTSSPGSVYELIKKADSLMYSAKEKGKNMIQHEVI